MADTVGAQPNESEKERVDRELKEFREETRIVSPGLELLFGFLRILPFGDRFGELVANQRVVYLACLVATALAAALLVAPSARHRLRFRSVDKEHLLFVANRYLIAGLALVALSIALAVYLASSMVLASSWAAWIASFIAAWFAVWWFLLPLLRR